MWQWVVVDVIIEMVLDMWTYEGKRECNFEAGKLFVVLGE